MKMFLQTAVAVAAIASLGACGILGKGPKGTPTVGNRVSILTGENDIAADTTIADVQVLLPAPEVNANWAQPGGSASKAMGQLALGATPTRVWTARVEGGTPRARLAATPVIGDGKLFAIGVNATVHAFAADTGAQLWSTSISDNKDNREARFGGGVSYDDNRVFATTGLGEVVALNAADGKEVWRAKPGGPLRGSPTISNGAVYVLSQDNQLFAIDQTNGQVQWAASGTLETQGVFGVGAPAVSQGSIVAGYSSGELSAYRYENGRVLWQDALSRSSGTMSVSSLADIDASPVIEGGRVYAVGQGGRMVALELSTGQRLWEQNFAGISTPWIAGEWVFVVTDDARLVCLARTTGKARWIAQLRRYGNEKKRSNPVIWYGPVLAGNRLAMTNSRGEIVFVSPGNGAVQQTIDAGGSFTLPPIVANQTLYTLDQAGAIAAYR